MNYRKIMEEEPDQETLKKHLHLLFGTTDLAAISEKDLAAYWLLIRPRLLKKEATEE